jgi:hypothetical protein
MQKSQTKKKSMHASLRRKSMAASSSSTSCLRGALRNSISNWICWYPLLFNVCSLTNSCKLFKHNFITVDITDSCKVPSLVYGAKTIKYDRHYTLLKGHSIDWYFGKKTLDLFYWQNHQQSYILL